MQPEGFSESELTSINEESSCDKKSNGVLKTRWRHEDLLSEKQTNRKRIWGVA
jgi:hypothetical protein